MRFPQPHIYRKLRDSSGDPNDPNNKGIQEYNSEAMENNP